MRLIVAAIVGGIVMFAWGFVSHMILGVGDNGMKSLSNEDAVIAALKSNINEPGIYFVPGMDMSRTPTNEEWAAFSKKAEAGPTAFLVYNPTGETPFSAKQLGIEFASNVLGALIVAFILNWTAPSIGKRIIIATLIGLAGWVSIEISYWDWYRFPGAFVTGELIEQVVGWLLTGAAIALIIKRKVTESLS